MHLVVPPIALDVSTITTLWLSGRQRVVEQSRMLFYSSWPNQEDSTQCATFSCGSAIQISFNTQNPTSYIQHAKSPASADTETSMRLRMAGIRLCFKEPLIAACAIVGSQSEDSAMYRLYLPLPQSLYILTMVHQKATLSIDHSQWTDDDGRTCPSDIQHSFHSLRSN